MGQFVAPALIGVGLMFLGWWQYRKVRRSRGWPSAPGRIVANRVEARTVRGDEDSADSICYYPEVEYEYQAGPTALRGNRIAFDTKGYARAKEAEQALVGYPPGAFVPVYYDPARPGDAVLERKASNGVVLLAIGGGIAALAVVAMLKQ